MLSLELMGRVPYHTVYLHGLIRNEHGEKISKSMPDAWKYDPLYIVDEYGTDALRYTLATSSTAGNDMNLDLRRIEGARNFANKIWQATRFILMNVEDENTVPLDDLDPELLTLVDRWILSRVQTLTADVTRLMDDNQYGEAGRQVRDFLWDEFCDWYIEAAKGRLYGDRADKSGPKAVLVTVLEQAMRLLHPFMPFVTEAVWQALPETAREGPALIVGRWPVAEPAWIDEAVERQMAQLIALVQGIRAVRSEYSVEPSRRIAATFSAGSAEKFLASERDVLIALARLDQEQTIIVGATEPLVQSASVVVGDAVVYLPLAGMVDLEAERARLGKELASLESRIVASEERLGGPFAARAPAGVVQREREKLEEMRAEAAQIRDQAQRLG